MQRNNLIITIFLCLTLMSSCNNDSSNVIKPIDDKASDDSALKRKIKESNKIIEVSSAFLEKTKEIISNKYADCVFFKESRIKYDSDFIPSLFAIIQNNMDQDIVAVEILIETMTYSADDCKGIIIKKKIVIPSKKSVTFQQKIKNESDNSCGKLDHVKITLGDFILKDGTKTNVGMEKLILHLNK